jgi:arginyl-tRNA--protein-N-Asp/Glu arginylyltransferase
MKYFHSEFAHDYSTYAFGYTLHAALEKGDSAESAYEAGFLPYSANPKEYNLLYMARSVRVPIDKFSPSSENRRVFKKFDDTFVSRIVPRAELEQDKEFHQLFLDYFLARHGQKVMGAERLQGILKTELPLRGIRYETKEGELIAAVFEPTDGAVNHFWFPAYHPRYIGASLGMWLMLDGVRRAATEGRSHLYLGTAYGEKARYKLNIENIEFWDGTKWVADDAELKARMKEDNDRIAPVPSRFGL